MNEMAIIYISLQFNLKIKYKKVNVFFYFLDKDKAFCIIFQFLTSFSMVFLKDDIFARIVDRSISADIVYETDRILAFRDIAPKARVHILIIPKASIKTAKEITTVNIALFGELFLAAKEIAQQQGLTGYKLHMNVDEDGGQVVPHVHLHLLSPDYASPL